MHHYQHHIGDYEAATSHLTWDEDMAYMRLLRVYYRDEKPLPKDLTKTLRLVRAKKKSEAVAVENVLSEFFDEMDDGWHNQRADNEIARYHEKSEKARKSANARHSQSERNADAMLTVNRKPLTENHILNTCPIEGEGEQISEQVDRLYEAFPRKIKPRDAKSAIAKALKKIPFDDLLVAVQEFAASPKGKGDFCPYPATWFNAEQWNDDRKEWQRGGNDQQRTRDVSGGPGANFAAGAVERGGKDPNF